MPDGFNSVTSIANEALAGLTNPRKTLPPKLFYDDEGCRLFGEITRLPEYYVTRAERSLLESVAPKLDIPAGSALVEYGASDEAKAAVLLEHSAFAAYVPIDVAGHALAALVDRMATSHPGLSVFSIPADFLRPFEPTGRRSGPPVARLLSRVDDRQPGTVRRGRIFTPGRGHAWRRGPVLGGGRFAEGPVGLGAGLRRLAGGDSRFQPQPSGPPQP